MPADGQADLEEVAKVSAEEDPMKDLDQAVAEMEADLTCLLEAEAKVGAAATKGCCHLSPAGPSAFISSRLCRRVRRR